MRALSHKPKFDDIWDECDGDANKFVERLAVKINIDGRKVRLGVPALFLNNIFLGRGVSGEFLFVLNQARLALVAPGEEQEALADCSEWIARNFDEQDIAITAFRGAFGQTDASFPDHEPKKGVPNFFITTTGSFRHFQAPF